MNLDPIKNWFHVFFFNPYLDPQHYVLYRNVKMEKTEARGDGKREEEGGRKKKNHGRFGERRYLLQKEASQVVVLIRIFDRISGWLAGY